MQDERVVAIVDDDPVTSMMLEHVISAGGFTARLFSTPQEFLAYMTDHRPACILLDMNMPEMTGIEVQCRLRDMGSMVPVIMVSAETDVATATATLNNGASNFIPKPVDPQEVIRLIREVTNRAFEDAA